MKKIKTEILSSLDHDELTDILCEQTTYPYDYIRCIDKRSLISYYHCLISKYFNQPDSKFFIAKDNNLLLGFINLKLLKWDSDILGFKCARVTHIISRNFANSLEIKKNLLSEALSWSTKNNIKFIDCHIHPLELSGIGALAHYNFSIITTHLHHIWDLRGIHNLDPPTQYPIRVATWEDLPRLISIVPEIIPKYSRFVLDEKIYNTGKVISFFEKWIISLLKERAKCFVIAELDEKVVGYAGVVLDEMSREHLGLNIGNIELIGVSKSARGRGIYRDIIKFILSWAKQIGLDILKIVIHACNAPANVVPPQLNARVLGAHHTFHWHAE